MSLDRLSYEIEEYLKFSCKDRGIEVELYHSPNTPNYIMYFRKSSWSKSVKFEIPLHIMSNIILSGYYSKSLYEVHKLIEYRLSLDGCIDAIKTALNK
jgi:hypothetical protein